jgi:2-isopropylmalate synthase
VHVSGILGNPATYEFMDPVTLGITRSYTIDKYTGKHALESKLRSMGIALADSEVIAVLTKIKGCPDTRYFDDDKLLEIVSKTRLNSIVTDQTMSLSGSRMQV